MRIIFMGTPDYAVQSLKKLIASRHDVAAVVTQPDRQRNRNELSFCPVKKFAVEHNLPVLQYEKVSKEGIEDLKKLKADVIVTVAYGQILSSEVLSLTKYGVINSHASLLPKYRGSSPIQWAVINGEAYTGVTIMKTAQKVDSGDIILQKKIAILQDETAGELFNRLAVFAGDTLIEGLALIESGKAVYTPQNHEEATHFPMLKKEDGKIDFSLRFEGLKHFILGMTPWPSAFTYIGGKIFKIYEIEKADGFFTEYQNGEIVEADEKNGLIVKISDGLIRLKTLQPENGKRMTDTDYLRGHKLEKQILGLK